MRLVDGLDVVLEGLGGLGEEGLPYLVMDATIVEFILGEGRINLLVVHDTVPGAVRRHHGQTAVGVESAGSGGIGVDVNEELLSVVFHHLVVDSVLVLGVSSDGLLDVDGFHVGQMLKIPAPA